MNIALDRCTWQLCILWLLWMQCKISWKYHNSKKRFVIVHTQWRQFDLSSEWVKLDCVNEFLSMKYIKWIIGVWTSAWTYYITSMYWYIIASRIRNGTHNRGFSLIVIGLWTSFFADITYCMYDLTEPSRNILAWFGYLNVFSLEIIKKWWGEKKLQFIAV